METIKLDQTQSLTQVAEKVAAVLREGGLVIHPTDTTYGIAIDPTNHRAWTKVFDFKQREASKALSLVVPTLAEIERIAVTDRRIERILHHYLPGPFSFLLLTADFRYCPLSTIVVRLPEYPLIQAITAAFKAPFTSTSANLSGDRPAYSLSDMEERLMHPEFMTVVPDLIIDAGHLPIRQPSTIIDLTSWPPQIIRQGDGQFDWQQFS